MSGVGWSWHRDRLGDQMTADAVDSNYPSEALPLLLRFEPTAVLDDDERAFIDLMQDQLPELVIVPVATMPGARRLGDLHEVARPLALNLNAMGMGAYREGLVGMASAAFALSLRCLLHESNFGDREVIRVLRHWAMAKQVDGDYTVALDGLRAVQHLLAQVTGDDDPEALDNHNDIAVLLLDVGDHRAALAILRPLVARNRRVRPGRGKDPHTLTAQSNLADALRLSGDYRAALTLARRIWRERQALTSLGPDHPDTLVSANSVGYLLQLLGDLHGARVALEEVLARRRRLDPEHPDTITAMANLATNRYALGDWQQALNLEREVLQARRRQAGPTHPDTLTAANNLSGTLRDMGQLAEASTLLRSVIKAGGGTNLYHPEAIEIQLNLAEVHYEMGRNAMALRQARRVMTLLDGRGVLDARDFQRYGRLARLLYMRGADADLREFFPRTSARMWRTLELLDLASTHQLLDGFRDFHDIWVRQSLERGLDEVPRALAPLHGLESAAWVRSQLDALQDDPKAEGADTRADYRAVRQRLAATRQQLQQLDARLRGVDPQAQDEVVEPLAHQERTRLRRKRQTLLGEERDGIEALRQVRERLQAEYPDIAAGLSVTSPTIGSLQTRLGGGEAVLFLIQSADRQTVALVVTPTRRMTQFLPRVESLRDRFRAYEQIQNEAGRGVGLRGGVGLRDRVADTGSVFTPDEDVADSASALSGLQQAVREAFWDPLAGPLAGVVRLHLVYAPTLRGFAFDVAREGREGGRTCAYYASLPGWLRVVEAPPPRPPGQDSMQPGLTVVFDCAWNTSAPLPFTRAEACLLQTLWPHAQLHQGREALPVFAAARSLGRIHVACHGTVTGQADERHAVILLDAAAGTVAAPADIAPRAGAVDELVCSTCVGGIVSERVGVDAMGIVSGLQHHGAHAIVACLAPVSDFHMPLLIALYWHARGAGHAPAQALGRAKARLLGGDWPDGLRMVVRQVYAETMTEVLARSIYRGRPTGDPRAVPDAALLLARGISGWILSPRQRQALGVSQPMSSYDHERFSRLWCAESPRRDAFAQEAADALVTSLTDWPQDHQVRIAHLCAFTQCFGGL